MRAVIQRVSFARVEIGDSVAGEIGAGFLVFLGICEGDGGDEAALICKKIAGLRIFCDDEDKMNLSLDDIGGEVLVISQFTLHADCSRGFRPSFIAAARPETAEPLYERVCAGLAAVLGEGRVRRGVFSADMQVTLQNDGPVTIVLDTDEMKKKRG